MPIDPSSDTPTGPAADSAAERRAAEPVDVKRALGMYRVMCRIRAFEEHALELLKAGELPGVIHPSIGQEAIPAAVCASLEPGDYVTSTHRGHGHALAKGADPAAMMGELFGRASGACKGKGGSMHIADFSIGMLGANGIVAAGIPIAVGAAQGIKLKGEAAIVACFFGDGAVNRGPFLEGLNWAAVYRLPVLFVCEDNGFAAFTRAAATTAGYGAAARAESIGLRAESVDGNDVLELDATVREFAAEVRGGEGPRFIHAKTYRVTGHTSLDKADYRSVAEVALALARDPLKRLARELGEQGVEAEIFETIEAKERDAIQQAVEAARAAPWPEPESAFEDVQDQGAPR